MSKYEQIPRIKNPSKNRRVFEFINESERPDLNWRPLDPQSSVLILLLIAVYPANLYLAFYEEPQKLIGISAFSASWIRLPIQFIFLGFAYWHAQD